MRRIVGVTIVVVIVAGAVLVVCVAFAPAWIVRHDLGPADVAAADRLNAVNNVRSTVLQGLAGVVALAGVGLGAAVTLRQVRVSREGQFIDLFTKALEQLSSDEVLVRQGGAYAMEQIAEAAPHYRGHVGALLATFVRHQAPWPPAGAPGEVDAERQRWTGGLRDDVAGAMAALSRRTMVLPGFGIELEKVDLRGAYLAGLDLSRFCFAGSNLDGAILARCNLSHATLDGATLKGADLTGATLTGATLAGVDLADVDLTGVVGLEQAPSPQPPSAE
jgi:hypothetical protein